MCIVICKDDGFLKDGVGCLRLQPKSAVPLFAFEAHITVHLSYPTTQCPTQHYTKIQMRKEREKINEQRLWLISCSTVSHRPLILPSSVFAAHPIRVKRIFCPVNCRYSCLSSYSFFFFFLILLP